MRRRLISRTGLAFSAMLLSIEASPSSAAAYSDSERFSAPADEGGGGGRFFTGSPNDGYTCSVCHGGGVAPQVSIAGLPLTGFGPNQVFEVQLTLSGAQGNHALALEMVDGVGKNIALELLPEGEIGTNERCGAAPGGKRASYLVQNGERRIVGLEACEATALRFRFRTTDADRVTLVGTALATDNSATVQGDGVTEITQTLYRDGRAVHPAATGCSSLHTGGRPSGMPWYTSALLAIALRGLGRRRRQLPEARAA